MHHCCLAKGQLQSTEGDVPVQEASLVNEPQDFCLGHSFLGPLIWPVVEHVLSDLGRRVIGAEQELFGLSAHQDQPQVDLVSWNAIAHDEAMWWR